MHVLAFLIAEKITVSGRDLSLSGMLDTLESERLPVAAVFELYAWLTAPDERAGTPVDVEFVLMGERIARFSLGSLSPVIPFTEPGRAAELRLQYGPSTVEFPAFGRYILQLLVDGTLLAERELWIQQQRPHD